MLHRLGFPGGSNGKESACNAGDPCLIPGLGRSPGGGNGYPLQYSWLENPMDRDPGGLQSMGSQRVGHDWLLYRFLPEDSVSATRKVLVAYLCPTLCDPKDCSLPDSSVHGILQARTLEWVAISSSRGSSPSRDRTHISCVSCILEGRFFTAVPPGKPVTWEWGKHIEDFILR